MHRDLSRRSKITNPKMMKISEILGEQVRPSLGCTEPAAVALAASTAYHALSRPGKDIEKILVSVDRNVYKNSLAVGIPGTHGLTGIYAAAALGAYCDPVLGLNLFSDSDERKLSLAKGLLKKDKVDVEVKDKKGEPTISIKARVWAKGSVGEAWIQYEHSNVTFIKRDDTVLYDKRKPRREHAVSQGLKDLAAISLSGIVHAVENLSREDKDLIRRGIEMNRKAAAAGLKTGAGLGIGHNIESFAAKNKPAGDEVTRAKVLTAAAGDAQMSGLDVQVMTSAGSGNQGIVAILPIVAVAEARRMDTEKLIRAAALSHLITAYITCHSGYLSAICGCGIKAGVGAAAGVTYYLGGGVKEVGMAVNNMAGNITGMICDGAKPGCSLKMATAAGCAVESALLAMKGVSVPPDNGIVGYKPEDTLKNIGLISKSTASMDEAIVKIMTEKKK